MNKFNRKDDKGVMVPHIGTNGVITEVSTNTFENINKKKYHRFTAEVDTPNGKMQVTGQLYEKLVPHLGGIPEKGTKMSFNATVKDILDGKNHQWNIGSARADAITDDLISFINDLPDAE